MKLSVTEIRDTLRNVSPIDQREHLIRLFCRNVKCVFIVVNERVSKHNTTGREAKPRRCRRWKAHKTTIQSNPYKNISDRLRVIIDSNSTEASCSQKNIKSIDYKLQLYNTRSTKYVTIYFGT